MFNAFTAQAFKISGLKDTRTCLQTRFPGPVTHLFAIQCVWMKIISHASAKKKKKKKKREREREREREEEEKRRLNGLRISNFALLSVVFNWCGSKGVNGEFLLLLFFPKSSWQGPRSQEVYVSVWGLGGGGEEGGVLTLRCRRYSGFCIQMGSDERHFIMFRRLWGGSVTRQCPHITAFEHEQQPNQGIEPTSPATLPNALPVGQTGSH